MHRIVELALANRILVILTVCVSIVAGSFATAIRRTRRILREAAGR